MPYTLICTVCKGEGHYKVLVSQGSDETETVKCKKCNETGFVRQMTEKEESDYWEDYW